MKKCSLCQKGSRLAGGYSNRTRATKFNPTGSKRRQPNLHLVRLPDNRRLLICTRCLKNNELLARADKKKKPLNQMGGAQEVASGGAAVQT